MQNEPNLIRQVRDGLRMEIRRKKLEDEFTQLRRKMLKLSISKNCTEMETEQTRYQLVKPSPPIDFFIFLIKQLQLDQDTIEKLREIIWDIQYQLDNGMELNLLEWAGQVDIVKILIEALKQFKKNPGYLAVEISNCLLSLSMVQKKQVVKSLRAQAHKAIEVYQEWFSKKNPYIKEEASKGMFMLTEKNQEIPRNFMSNEEIDNILSQLQCPNTSPQRKYFLWELIRQNVKFISSESQIILILKIAQKLIESQNGKKLQVGLNIIYEVCQNEQNISFVLSLSCWSIILNLIGMQNQGLKLQILQILQKVSLSEDQQMIEFFIQYDILSMIYNQLNSREAQIHYYSTQILCNFRGKEDIYNKIISNNQKNNDFIDMEIDYSSIKTNKYQTYE